MSNIVQFENTKQIILKQEIDFNNIAKIHNAVNFKKESCFALQILQNNQYTAGIAANNLDSLKNAIINVAAIGLSLSPVHKLAYLVPRDGRVCLDISYAGLIQLATDCGSISWALADVVYESDNFTLNGFGKAPNHDFKPFSKDRGAIVGAYCCAKTPDGDYITSIMDISEIYKIRMRSEAFKKNSGPWKTDENEMIKKTLVKRASKSWPKISQQSSERLIKALAADEEDYIDAKSESVSEPNNSGLILEITDLINKLGKTMEHYLLHLSKTCRREIKSLENLTPTEIKQAKTQVDQWVEQNEKKKLKTDEVKIENASTDQ